MVLYIRWFQPLFCCDWWRENLWKQAANGFNKTDCPSNTNISWRGALFFLPQARLLTSICTGLERTFIFVMSVDLITSLIVLTVYIISQTRFESNTLSRLIYFFFLSFEKYELQWTMQPWACINMNLNTQSWMRWRLILDFRNDIIRSSEQIENYALTKTE